MEHRSDCEQLIADLVENHFGIEKHLKGCTYLKEAIEIAVQNPITFAKLTKPYGKAPV